MGETVLLRAREALVQWLTRASAALPDKGARLHYLAGPPRKAEELPAISISFPVCRVRPVGLGGVLGVETPRSGKPRTLLGARLEGTVQFDCWAGSPSPLDDLTSMLGVIQSALAGPGQDRRAAGFLKLHHGRTDEVKEASSQPLWQLPGKGLTCSVSCELLFEVTLVPEEVEGLIKTVNVTMAEPASGEKFKVQSDRSRR